MSVWCPFAGFCTRLYRQGRATQPLNRPIGLTTAFCFALTRSRAKLFTQRLNHVATGHKLLRLTKRADDISPIAVAVPARVRVALDGGLRPDQCPNPELAKHVRMRVRVAAFTVP